MPLSSSGTIRLSEIKTEFGGGTPPNNIRSYYRGGGYVRNHGVNSSIPTSGTIRVRDFYNASKNFTASITSGFDLIVTGTFPSLTQNNYKGYLGGVDAFLGGTDRGPFGSITQTQYGTSASSTSSAIVFGVFRWVEGNRLIFEFTGNWTSNPTIFTSITVGSTTYNRTSASSGPTYDVAYNHTSWQWSGVTTDIFASSPTSFTITP